jgi:hypothetical protein
MSDGSSARHSTPPHLTATVSHDHLLVPSTLGELQHTLLILAYPESRADTERGPKQCYTPAPQHRRPQGLLAVAKGGDCGFSPRRSVRETARDFLLAEA